MSLAALMNDAPDFIGMSLTDEQWDLAQYVAAKRQAAAEANRRTGAHGFEAQGQDPLRVNLLGACGEFAWSLFSGISWDPVLPKLWDEAGKKYPDVGPFEVRAADDHDKRLILHQPWSPECKRGDPSERPFVLVTGEPPHDLAVRGWIMAADGQDKRWWTDPGTGRPAYFVPHAALSPITEALERYHHWCLRKLLCA